MNDAHLHLIVNHFPIIGTILGFGILITGFILKNNTVKNTAYVLFIVVAIFGAISMSTGEGAEDIAEKLPGVTDEIIHEHEELAEKLAIVLYATGFFALLSLFAAVKKHKFSKIFSVITLILALTAGILSKGVGTSGGEIRHTEIREKSMNTDISTDESSKNENSTSLSNQEEKDND